MQNFKQYLQESNHSLSASEIRTFIKNYKAGTLENWKHETTFPVHKVEKDGTIVFGSNAKSLRITDPFIENGELIFPMKGEVDQLVISSEHLSSLKNLPDTVGFGQKTPKNFERYGFVISRTNQLLTSLEHFPKTVRGHISLEMAPNVSYSNVHKHITSLRNQIISINGNYVGPLLSFVKIPRAWGILDTNRLFLRTQPTKRNLERAVKIINKYMRDPNLNRDVLACQDELLENGLKEFAKL